MMNDLVVDAPATYVPEVAVTFGTRHMAATPVDLAHPLPTRATLGAAAASPLAGTLAAPGGVVGPFVPELARAIWVTLSGTWSGTAQLLRSTDGGATRLPLTYGDGSAKPGWTGALNAPVGEESVVGAAYYLAATLASGTLAYRMEQ